MGLTAVGVDLGGTKIAAALVNEQGRILKSSRLSTNVEGGASAVVAQTTELVKELAGISGSSVVGIGVGVAGQIEAESGVVRFAPNLDWHDVPLQSQLSAACSLPVVITNDVRAITWGEWLFGAGKGCDDLICAFVGTGIGGGVVINGKVVSGCSNTAGEIGHITIDLHGSKCSCGNHGCLETLAGGWGIAHQAEQAVAADPAAGAKLSRWRMEKHRRYLPKWWRRLIEKEMRWRRNWWCRQAKLWLPASLLWSTPSILAG